MLLKGRMVPYTTRQQTESTQNMGWNPRKCRRTLERHPSSRWGRVDPEELVLGVLVLVSALLIVGICWVGQWANRVGAAASQKH